ncbi:MAG: F0F1 ATP synthase subunit A [Acidobacteria bacterium]|nr:F0F1 ATP synthase subunit A [Acidobacteriota bacterium]MBV9145827.1 F0F1 ATP synthase subunit A [Acidobacteriota bacterium]
MEQLFFTRFLNQYFGGFAARLLSALGAHPVSAGEKTQYLFTYNPAAPISNFFAMELLVVGILVVLFLWARARISVDNPGPMQHIFELTEQFIDGQSEEIIGHHSSHFTPFLVALGLFILISNLIGLIPGFESPTATPTVPLGLAIVAWLYYHFHGIKKQGPVKYAKHFVGPMPILAPLMIPIEIISHIARMMSLTIRLYANIFAGDLVTLVFFSLIPIGIPVIFLGLHLFVSLLQAYIFVLLATVYLAGAVAEEH